MPNVQQKARKTKVRYSKVDTIVCILQLACTWCSIWIMLGHPDVPWQLL